jgi:hypothetical protein
MQTTTYVNLGNGTQIQTVFAQNSPMTNNIGEEVK